MRLVKELTEEAKALVDDYKIEERYRGRCQCPAGNPPCSMCVHPGRPEVIAEVDSNWRWRIEMAPVEYLEKGTWIGGEEDASTEGLDAGELVVIRKDDAEAIMELIRFRGAIGGANQSRLEGQDAAIVVAFARERRMTFMEATSVLERAMQLVFDFILKPEKVHRGIEED